MPSVTSQRGKLRNGQTAARGPYYGFKNGPSNLKKIIIVIKSYNSSISSSFMVLTVISAIGNSKTQILLNIFNQHERSCFLHIHDIFLPPTGESPHPSVHLLLLRPLAHSSEPAGTRYWLDVPCRTSCSRPLCPPGPAHQASPGPAPSPLY